MHHPRAISKVGRASWHIGQEVVPELGYELGVVGCKGRAMLPAQVTDLARRRVSDVAGRVFAATVGVEMGARRVAVAIFGDRVFVDVVYFVMVSFSSRSWVGGDNIRRDSWPSMPVRTTRKSMPIGLSVQASIYPLTVLLCLICSWEWYRSVGQLSVTMGASVCALAQRARPKRPVRIDLDNIKKLTLTESG